jgi:hypothetical protein
LKLESLARCDVTTRLGVLPLWSRPGVFDGSRPLVLAIQGMFAGPDDLCGLPEALERLADVAIVRVPLADEPQLSDPSLAGFAQAISDLVSALFAARPVVLLGVSLGATAALAVKAPSLRRIVAVEPLLATGGLWPIQEPLRAELRAAPRHAGLREVIWRHFGVGPEQAEGRDHLSVLDGLSAPTDVILGGEPLEPPRQTSRFPSLVGVAERARLAAQPAVRLHLAPQAGHNVQGQASKLLTDVLFEACRRAAAEPAHDTTGLDEVLVEATSLTAARVLHWGPGGPAFAGRYLPWNPAAAVEVLGEDPAAAPDPGEAPFDALVLGAPPPAGLLERLSRLLAPGGCLVARWAPARDAGAEVLARLERCGLRLREAVDEAGVAVLRAERIDGPPPPALRLVLLACASFLMDVRTRLPARGLRADPELRVEYLVGPCSLPLAATEEPKILVLQRPADPLDQAFAQVAYAMARDWLMVIEYDDHPALTAEAVGKPYDENELKRFGMVHAVETSTEALARIFRPSNPELRVFENSVFELAPFPAEPRPRRVFYGAVSRGEFGVAVARSLAPVTAEFPDLEFVVLADRAVFEALPTANKRFEDYLTYEGYLARMAGCAVSLSPIEPKPWREMKSDAKFLDAARAGVLTIGSPLIYEGAIEHGVNGLLARRLEDWAPLLRRMLAEPEERRAMALRAWDEVRRERMFALQARARRDWYLSLWARRAELNAALLARVPGLAEAVAAETARLRG